MPRLWECGMPDSNSDVHAGSAGPGSSGPNWLGAGRPSAESDIHHSGGSAGADEGGFEPLESGVNLGGGYVAPAQPPMATPIGTGPMPPPRPVAPNRGMAPPPALAAALGMPQMQQPRPVAPAPVPMAAAPVPIPVSAPQAAQAPTAPVTDEEEAPKASYTMYLVTWASIATIATIWLLWTRPDPKGYLEAIKDDGKHGIIVDPFEPLTSRQFFTLGETKEFGDLEITPLKVEYRPVKLLPRGDMTDPVLVLKLKITNKSDRSFYPLDELFLYPDPKMQLEQYKNLKPFKKRGYTYTYIHAEEGGSRSSIILSYDLMFEEDKLDGQAIKSLKPGESMITSIVSEEVKFKEDVKGSSLVWRVKVRQRGRSGSTKGVAGVIGVKFQKSDVEVKKA